MYGEHVYPAGADDAGPPIFRRLWMTGLLGPEDMREIAGLSWSRQVLFGESSFDCGEDLCILSSGLAFRQRWDEGGERHVVSLVLPGDICVYTCITGHRPSSILTSVTTSTLMRASLREVAELCHRRPNVLAAILANLSCDNAATEELLISVGRRSALRRLAHLFCELEFRLRRMGQARNAQFVLNLTQAEIGDYVALSAVHVNRTMQELRRRDLVRNQGPRFTLPNLSELQRVAGFSPGYLGYEIQHSVAAE